MFDETNTTDTSQGLEKGHESTVGVDENDGDEYQFGEGKDGQLEKLRTAFKRYFQGKSAEKNMVVQEYERRVSGVKKALKKQLEVLSQPLSEDDYGLQVEKLKIIVQTLKWLTSKKVEKIKDKRPITELDKTEMDGLIKQLRMRFQEKTDALTQAKKPGDESELLMQMREVSTMLSLCQQMVEMLAPKETEPEEAKVDEN